jgi:hypothetical protein
MKGHRMPDGGMKRRLAGATVALALLAFPAAAGAAVDDLLLVSRADGLFGAGAESFSVDSSISDNGCHIAFNGTADNLGPSNPTAGQNVFYRDVCAGTTELVALYDGTNVPANEFNSTATVSGDGCRVAFWTTDGLVPDDPDVIEEGGASFFTHAFAEGSVYVRDVCADTTILASRDTNGVSRPVSQGQTSISADGDRVAFSTGAHLDVEGGIPDGNPAVAGIGDPRDVYVRDIAAGDTHLASTNYLGTAGANGDSTTQTEARNSLSDNGRYLSMGSIATDLLPPGQDTNNQTDIYVRDMSVQANAFTRATLSDSDAQLTGPGVSPFFTWAISGDGRHIAFSSFAPQLPGNGLSQVHLRDLDAGTTELISRASGPEGAISSSFSARPALDESGRLVAFSASGENLVFGVDSPQIFVRDTLNQTTHVVSRKQGALGELSRGATAAEDPQFSDDSRFISFVSSSPGLHPDDANGGDQDVFRRELAEPPTPRTEVRFNARPLAGEISVRLPGADTFVPMPSVTQLPMGTRVDSRAGRVAITTTGNTQSKPVQTADFYDGVFEVTQSASTKATMRLRGPIDCAVGKGGKKGKKGKRKDGKRSASASAPRAQAAAGGRRVWGSGRGNYATRGRRGAGVVRGTTWSAQDRCNGSTVLEVTEGTIEIDDFGKKGDPNAVITAPGRYVAKDKPKDKKKDGKGKKGRGKKGR